MSITKKIMLATLPLFLLFGLVTMGLTIRALQEQSDSTLEAIRSQMSADKNEKLKDLVRNTFEILASQHRAANDPEMVAREYEGQLTGIVDLAYSSVEAIYQRTDIGEEEKKELARKFHKKKGETFKNPL